MTRMQKDTFSSCLVFYAGTSMILLRIIYEILNNELFFNEFFIHILGFAIDFFLKSYL